MKYLSSSFLATLIASLLRTIICLVWSKPHIVLRNFQNLFFCIFLNFRNGSWSLLLRSKQRKKVRPFVSCEYKIWALFKLKNEDSDEPSNSKLDRFPKLPIREWIFTDFRILSMSHFLENAWIVSPLLTKFPLCRGFNFFVIRDFWSSSAFAPLSVATPSLLATNSSPQALVNQLNFVFVLLPSP